MRTALLIVAVGAAAAPACSDEKPTFGDPGGALGRKLPNEPPASGGTGADGGDPFGNAPALTTTLRQGHTNQPGTPTGPDVDALDKSSDCLGSNCHGEPAANGKKWAFGGRVSSNGKPAENALVIVESDGQTLGPVRSDADGFFWLKGDAPVSATAKTKIKLNDVTAMGGALGAGGGGCDRAEGCHGGSRGRINVK